MTENERKQPKYGEYAPEGWQPPQNSTSSGDNTQLSGVPHNLGAAPQYGSRETVAQAPHGQERPAVPAYGEYADPAQSHNPQYAQGQQYSGGVHHYPQGGPIVLPPRKANTADKVITIILLVLGGLSAMYMAFASFGASFVLDLIKHQGIDPVLHEMHLESRPTPAWIIPTGLIFGAITIAAYIAVLVISIKRLSAAKITFWIPLVVGIIFTIAFTVLMVNIVIGLLPEELLNDPDLLEDFNQKIQQLK
ncbi:MAG: DUF6264 family protein [Microbacteriaceae bacterium]|nr:DUF6264 family protein [Microbacteriaceae bacterium]